LFSCLPHGLTAEKWSALATNGERILDLSADFRRDARFVYGIPELHRDRIREARWVAGAGCNATAAILGLFPLFRAGLVAEDRTVVEVKAGSSEAGRKATSSSHHPERSGSVRSYAPTGHRHTAEIEQALANGHPVRVHLSLTAVEMVRGAVATSHVFPHRPVTEKQIWNLYREAYRGEPFIRIVKEKNGIHRYPDPRLLAGTNFADVGFEVDEESGRVVVMSAIDNLMKGAAGQAVQCMNLMLGLDERTGLEFGGLHPL
jgi:N-acetyl-gamma-glutamyl-phosphate/LysW-gamma-L-alpha-aminoadipyl-6-phosphate reductase